MSVISPHRFSVAPMMDWTDRHCRFFHRCLTKKALLYTEMVTANAILHGDIERLIGGDETVGPVALQLGGSEPNKLAQAAKIGEEFGYCEINLNCGCPSERVQSGAFGACLMREPELVRDCVSAMQSEVRVPVTVKCRIGVDDDDPNERLFDFVETVAKSGCHTFIIHARKAWLKGLSPKENREIPPLDYPLVTRLKVAYPELNIILNGGLEDHESCLSKLDDLDGVMMGRMAYKNPAILADTDMVYFGKTEETSIFSALKDYFDYAENQLSKGVPIRSLTRHILGTFNGVKGARLWRQTLSNDIAIGEEITTLHQLCAHLQSINTRQVA